MGRQPYGSLKEHAEITSPFREGDSYLLLILLLMLLLVWFTSDRREEAEFAGFALA